MGGKGALSYFHHSIAGKGKKKREYQKKLVHSTSYPIRGREKKGKKEKKFLHPYISRWKKGEKKKKGA